MVEGFAGIMGEGANVAIFIGTESLLPQVGIGPKGSRDIPGSRAVYQRLVNPQGVTIKYTKTTYDAMGNIVHIKPK